MKDEELEVFVTLDDPEYGPQEDIFDHRHGTTAITSDVQAESDKTTEQKPQ